MRTISQAVEDHVMRSPFLMEALAERIANNGEIARKLRPRLEKELLKKVSTASISMALHRLQKRLDEPQSGMKLLKQVTNITLRSNLVAFICPNSTGLAHVLEVLSRHAAHREDAFLNFSRGLHESLFIVSREFEREVVASLKKGGSHVRIEGLSAITMKLSEKSLTMPGVYYPVLKAIALEGISFVEVMSIRTEFSIIFEDKDIDRAFSVIKRITS